jgi:transcriptional regulator GlxA family with amidase domain
MELTPLDFQIIDDLLYFMDKRTNFSAPYKVGFLLIDGFALMSYASVIEPLRAANQLARHTLYDVRNIPVSGASAASSTGALIRANAQIGERVDFDLVFVVAGGDPLAFRDARVFQWLRHLAARGVRLGGVSGGPVILALAGLMEARPMTVHWEHAPALGAVSPTLIIKRDLYVIDPYRITCAGGTAPLDMMYAFLTERHGPDFARQVSDWFMHTEIRPSAGAQRAGLVERYATTSPPVILAIEAMVNHIADTLALEQLADLAGVSPRQLNRLFREKLEQSTMSFYRNLRLERSHELLTQTTHSTTEIALASGFSSSAHFSHSFHKKYGRTPSSLRLR